MGIRAFELVYHVLGLSRLACFSILVAQSFVLITVLQEGIARITEPFPQSSIIIELTDY